MTLELKTVGHATLVVVDDGVPVVATDPWLIGSAYWRSWWLERYPTTDEIELVRNARALYVTHSHPDHFHWPSLRLLGRRTVLHPTLPGYEVPAFLEARGYPSHTLEPWRWYEVTERVRIASVPTLVDDSILVVDTPSATVVNLNDAMPRDGLLAAIRRRLLDPAKPVVVLKSYAPASSAVATYRDGVRVPLKSKQDYAATARDFAEALGARLYVPFASQAFFCREDSRWANEHKTTYEDLVRHWGTDDIELVPPFVTINLETLEHTSVHGEVTGRLDEQRAAQVASREIEEAAFALGDDFDDLLTSYMRDIRFLRLLFRKGIGWRLTTSGEERYFETKRRVLTTRIPEACDIVISLPDKVLYEALQNGILTDLGITMLIRVDTKVSRRRTYLAFLLMGLRDYGHVQSPRRMAAFVRFYLPYLVPRLFRPRPAPARPLPT